MLAAGRVLGDFTLGDPIDEGGLRTIYRARQDSLGRDAVVKVYRRFEGMTPDKFLREAKIASSLDHPYMTHVYAFGVEPDVLWLAMELVRGTTLRDVLEMQHGGRLPIARIAPFVDALCEVVHSLHEQNIVHCDLKSTNIMVVARGGRMLPKLLDLGLAKPVEARYPEGVHGTPLYMAPEQWRGGDEVGPRADIYALGAILYEIASGTPPFERDSIAELAKAHLEHAVPGGLPSGLDEVVQRAMAKRSDERFATTLELAIAVKDALGSRITADDLPRLADELRGELAWMPQPIAEAGAMLEAAKNPHQARDAVWQLVRVVVRWCGVIAIAARSQLGPRPGGDAAAVTDGLRDVARREIGDRDWLALVRGLVAPFHTLRDAYPVPELVELVEPDRADVFEPLFAAREADSTASEESLRDRLVELMPAVDRMIHAVGFLAQYPVIVPRGDRADVWLGARRGVRPVITIPPAPIDGTVQLADVDGASLLHLAPLVQVAAPTPGAPDELFVFAGPSRIGGARLVAEPHGFEHHDDEVWTWFRRELLPVDRDAEPIVDHAPYRGLAAFTEADACLFFGRERATEAFVNQLRVQPIAVIAGPSGTGKSSFVRAGVIPALPTGWTATVIRPGATPTTTLAARPRDARVLVIDQLEELFTLCEDAGERARFAEAVIAATRDTTTRVVMTVRDDFLARANELPAFRGRLAVTLLATPDDADLLRTLVLPAKRAGYDFDASLADDMVTAVRGHSGALALLSFTALELWSLRDRHFKRLTRNAYDAIGGVDGALAQHAEATLEACSADDKRRVREAFRHLVTSQGTRAVLSRSELDRVTGSATVVDALIASRLLVSEDDRIEVVHEALFDAWPRLVGWRRDDAEGARMRDQIRAAARQWADRDRVRGLLWRDDALDDYVRWRRHHPNALPALDEEFAAASVRDARRGRRIRRGLAAMAAVVLSAGVIALSLLYRSSRDNAESAHDQLVESYVVEGQHYLVDGDYASALRPLAEAYAAGDRSLGLRLMIHRAMKLADQPVIAFHGGFADPVFIGDKIVVAGFDGDAIAMDRDGRVVATLPAGEPGPMGPFGRATATNGHAVAISHPTSIVIWDGAIVREIALARRKLTRLAMDSTRLAVATESNLLVFELSSGTLLWTVPLDVSAVQIAWLGDTVIEAALDGTVRRLGATGSHALEMSIDPRQMRPLLSVSADQLAVITRGGVSFVGEHRAALELSGAVSSAVTRDGRRIAVGTGGGAITVYDIASGKRTAVLAGHGAIQRLAFTMNGDRLVSAGNDQTIRVWNVDHQQELVRYSGLRSTATAMSVSPDGAQIAIGTREDVRLYSVEDPSARLVVSVGEDVGISRFVGNDRIFTNSKTGLELWNGTTGALITRIDAAVTDAADVDATSALAAIPIAERHTVELRALPKGQLQTTLRMRADVMSARFDRLGERIVTASSDGTVELWTRQGERLSSFEGHRGLAFSAELSPSGAMIVSAGTDRTARLWDAVTGRPIGTPMAHDDDVYAAHFGATGTQIVTASNDRVVKLWDVTGPTQRAAFMHKTPVRNAEIDASGTVVAAVTTDGTVAVWDIASARELFELHHGDSAVGVAFSADRLLTTSSDGLAIMWDFAATVTARELEQLVECGLSRDNALVPRDTTKCP